MDLYRFLFNPLTLATCLGRSSSSFSNLAVLASIAHAEQGITFLGRGVNGCRFCGVSNGGIGDGELFEFISCIVAPSPNTPLSKTSSKCSPPPTRTFKPRVLQG